MQKYSSLSFYVPVCVNVDVSGGNQPAEIAVVSSQN